ncbi:MAG: NADH/ubiquinone/plastoquinone (complex I) [Planctomycetes bacterium]|nr:NADH/ubiquinone/plastoquinone (complex I) [Planctomycetota bacterium]
MVDLVPLFVAIPLAAAFLCLLLKRFGDRVCGAITLLGILAVLGLSLTAIAVGTDAVNMAGGYGVTMRDGRPFVAGIAIVLDGLARLFLLVVAVVGTAVVVYGFRYLERSTGRALYHVLLNLVFAGMTGAVLAGDVFNLFVFVEIASIASYALVAFGTGDREVEASFKYLLLGSIASLAILIGIAVLYAAGGFLNMADIAVAVREGRLGGAALLGASALFLFGFGLKAAMMPFHAWLPDAHPSAPAPISAVLSGLLIKTTGIYALVRVFFTILGPDPRVQTLLLVLGCVSMGAGVLLALGQDDLKRLLAYHSVSQMGFVLVGLGTGSALGVTAALFHAANHALFKSALFLSSGSLERMTGTRNLSEMGGLARRAPWTAAGTIGAALSISGIPPFNGFWSKLLILIALFSAGLPWAGTIAALTALLTLASFVKVQRKALFGALPERLAHVRDVPASMHVPVLVLSALCLLTFVLWPLGLGDVVQGAAATAQSADGQPPAIDSYLRLVLGRP